MSIKLKINMIDIANILITKGATFFSTFFIFTLMSNRLSPDGFANFGYWWSIGVMTGGVSLGGLGAALIREVSEYKTLSTIKKYLLRIGIILSVFIIIILLVLKKSAIDNPFYLFFISTLFGLSLTLQVSILSVLRAIRASKVNLIASVLLMTLIPLYIYTLVPKNINIASLLSHIVVAYTISLIFILIASRKILSKLLSDNPIKLPNNRLFFSNIGSFGLLTIFGSVILIVDVSIFKYNPDPTDFHIIATSKIYFERFILPLLMVLSSALSLMVLRYDSKHPATLELHLTRRGIAKLIATLMGIIIGYYFYMHIYSIKTPPLPIPIVILITIGYLLYVFNGVLLDVLVIRKKISTVFFYVISLLILYIIGQFIMNSNFGIIGWSVFWFLFHLFASTILYFSGCATTNNNHRTKV